MVQGRISDRRRRGVGTDEVRRHNLAAVLQQLHLGHSFTRSELAERTGLNRSTIGDLLGELAGLGVVTESPGTATHGPGRPSSVARVEPSGALVLAIDLGVDSIAVATVGLGAVIFDVERCSIPSDAEPQDVARRVAPLAQGLLDRIPEGRNPVGVGVGVAGIVRRSDGLVHTAPNLGWNDVPIAQILERHLEITNVRVSNEADLGALGEFRRGAGKASRDMVFITGDVGIGVGIIHASDPMLGVSGHAGEAGHTRINPDGRPCRCGSRGCWETEAGLGALLKRAGIDPGTVERPVAELKARLDAGHARTLDAVEETGRWMGVGIGNLINLVNPDSVVLGGGYHSLYAAMGASIEASAKEVALDPSWNACRILRGELGDDAILLGAAELVLSEVVADPATRLRSPS